MANDITIDTLPVAAPLTGVEMFPADQGAPAATVQIDLNKISTFIESRVSAFKADGSVDMTDALSIKPDGTDPNAVAALHLSGRADKESFIEGTNKNPAGTWKLGRLMPTEDKVTLMVDGDFEIVVPAGMAIGSNVGGLQRNFAYVEDTFRPTVVAPLSDPATKMEALGALKLVPGYANTPAFWAKGHEIYVIDQLLATKMVLLKYTGTAGDENDVPNMRFWSEELTLLA